MNIYIDFDGTIFDLDSLNNDFIKLFNNIDNNYIKSLIKKYKNYYIVTDILIKNYHLEENYIDKVNNLFQNNYIYKDAITFLEKYYQKYNLILLTYSNSIEYQKKKINSSNIDKYFKDIIITTKDKSKLDNIDYQNGIFIDNNPYELKKLYNKNISNIIRINHINDTYHKEKTFNNTKEYPDFIELINNKHIEKIGENIYE